MPRRNQSRNTSSLRFRNPSPPPPVDPPQVDTMGIVFADQAFSANFLKISRRRVKPTKFYDSEVADALGVRADITMLFEGVDLGSWLELYALTYRRLTLEFLSSLCVHRDTTRSPRYMTFQLMNAQHRMSVARVNQAFGWPVSGTMGPKDRQPRNYGG